MRNFIKEHRKFLRLNVIACLLLLAGCTATGKQAPMVNVWPQTPTSTIHYTVQKNDTLYSIAFGFGVDYRQLAQDNNITPPAYKIRSGQTLKIAPPAGSETATPAPISTAVVNAAASTVAVQAANSTAASTNAAQASTANTPVTHTPVNNVISTPPAAISAVTQPGRIKVMSVHTITKDGIQWAWPARGKLINLYNANSLNKGIDIAGKAGAPVLAAASGRVVYSGAGLRGYGQLIIIKNSDDFLSAYAHNQKLLVREGQKVQVGQVIATMGNTEAQRVMLHFEIRRMGKPIDPLAFLPTH